MAESRLRIVIEAATGRAQQQLRGLTGAAKNLTTVFAGFVSAAIAGGLARIAERLYELGAASERAATSLDLLTKGQADVYVKALGEASLGTIPKLNMMAASSRALRLGVVSNAEEMANLTQVAIALGRTMGLDATQALNDLVTGIGRASPMILDNLGLVIKQADIQTEMNRLMREDASLTEASAQRRATLNMALEQGNLLLDEMGGLTEDAASQTEQLNAEVSDLEASMGGLVAEGLAPAVTNLNDLIDLTRLLSKAQKDYKAEAARTSATLDEYIAKLQKVGLATIWFGNLGPVRREFEKLRAEQFEAEDAARRLAIREREAARALREAGEAAFITAEGTKELVDTAKEAVGGGGFEGLFGDLAEAVGGGTAQLQGLAGVRTEGGGADKNAIALAVFRRIQALTNDPATLFNARVALGLATPEEIAMEAELERIVKLYVSGKIASAQLAAAVAAAEAGNIAGMQGIQGTGGIQPGGFKGGAAGGAGGSTHAGSTSIGGQYTQERAGGRSAPVHSGKVIVDINMSGITDITEAFRAVAQQSATQVLEQVLPGGGRVVGPAPRRR